VLLIDFKKGKLTAELSPDQPQYTRIHIILRSLLSSSSVGPNVWSLTYDDFLTFKEKLDNLGLVDGRQISTEALNYVSECRAKDVRNEDIKNGVHNDFIKKSIEGKLKNIPYGDQVTGISYLVNNSRAGLFDSMGLGKTLISLSSIVANTFEIRKTLVICPNAVMMGFSREVEKHTHLKYIAIPSGRKTALKFLQDNRDGNWDVLLVHPENLIGSSKVKTYGDITLLLKNMPFDLIIVDEWHMYKNLDAKRTKCVLSLLTETRNKDKKRPRVILMSGTPISESPTNAYTTLKALSDTNLPHASRFEKYFTNFKNIKVKVKTKRGKTKHVEVPKVIGHKNLAELKRMIERVSIRRTKDDIEGFPDKIQVIRDVYLTGKHKKLYDAVCGELLTEISKESVINLSKFFATNATAIRLRQLLNHPAFANEDCDSCKYQEIDSILEELFADPEQKVVIWTEYRKAVDLMYDRWNKQYGVVKLYGGVDITEDLAKRFENESFPRIAACIPAKVGTGVDFLARARTAIYIDRPYSFTLYSQSLDRIHRRVTSSQTPSRLDQIRAQPATLIFLDVVGSIDELVREKLYAKKDLSDALTIKDEKLLTMGRKDLLRYLK